MASVWQALSRPWQVCLQEAWSAYRAGSLPIGAAVVGPDGSIWGRGRNRMFETVAERATTPWLFGHRLAHAEMNALVSVDHAAVDVRRAVLFTALEPCALCVGAIRMVGLKHVQYAARDTAAGSLQLFNATDYMRRGAVRIEHLGQRELEAVLIAMNVAAQLSLAQRVQIRPPVDLWESDGLPGVGFGRALFVSGHLERLGEMHAAFEPVLEELIASYLLEAPDGAASIATPPLTSRRALVVIVTGAPASGKSTLARQLAPRLGIPLFSKDLFKETLFDQLGWSDRQWSQRLGGASMALLFRSAAALLEAGHSVMIESNFYPELSVPALRELADNFACRFVQVVCTASTSTLLARYKGRITTGERHLGHTDSESLDEVLSRIVSGRWDALDVDGPVITVDTDQNQMPDIDSLAATVLAALR